MKNRSNKIFKILHKQNEIKIIIKKNKLSRNYKLTFDKKSLSGLVSIPRHISFNDGFAFVQENTNWLIEQYNEMMPIIKIENGKSIYFEGKKRKLVYLIDKKSNVELGDKSIIITNNKNIHQKIFYKWIKKEYWKKQNMLFLVSQKFLMSKLEI